jgi:hypothetical protein
MRCASRKQTQLDLLPLCRLDSGDEVVAVLVHEDGARVHAAVVDTRCASYSLQFQIHLSGEWTLTPCINGAQIPTAAVKVSHLLQLSVCMSVCLSVRNGTAALYGVLDSMSLARSYFVLQA